MSEGSKSALGSSSGGINEGVSVGTIPPEKAGSHGAWGASGATGYHVDIPSQSRR